MWIDATSPRILEPPTPPATGTPPEVAALCGLSEADWTRMLLDLLPVGPVWPRDPETVLWRFWSAVAVEPTRVQARDCDLLAESYPCGAVELLPEWESAVGLPNECTELATWTLPERQALVCSWLTMQGGQHPQYYIDLAAQFGYRVTIVEHPATPLAELEMGCFTVGACPFWWEVIVWDTPQVYATMNCWSLGESVCGTGAPIIECLIRMFAPAHTTVTFRYPQAPP